MARRDHAIHKDGFKQMGLWGSDGAPSAAALEAPDLDLSPVQVPGGPRIEPRDYQLRQTGAVYRDWADYQSTLLVAATGTGKTVTAALTAREWPRRAVKWGLSERTLFLAHREELVWQTRRAMLEVNRGDIVEVEMGEERVSRTLGGLPGRARIVLGSVQTMQGGRLESFPRDWFGQIIVDEAHHCVRKNATYQGILAWFQRAKRLGLTATPDRHDERALGASFESVADVFDLHHAIGAGWLVPVVQQLVSVEGTYVDRLPDKPGDWTDAEVSEVMREETPLAGVAEAAVTYSNAQVAGCRGERPTLVFAASVQHAYDLTEILNRRHSREGTGKAACVYSQAKGLPPMERGLRRNIVERYLAGDIRYLVNYGVLTEGFDAAETRVVVIARLTKSRQLYAQMVGRGTRPWPACVPALNAAPDAAARKAVLRGSPKPSVLVVDIVGSPHKLNGPVTAVDILGGWYDDCVIQSAKDAIAKKGGRGDIDLELRKAKLAEEAARRERRAGLLVKAKIKGRLVDPFDVLDVTVEREPGWFKARRPTPKMVGFLEKAGVARGAIHKLSFFKAGKLIDEIRKRRADGKCTYAQARRLRSFGENPDVSFEEARRLLDEIAANGWRPLR